MCVTVSIFIIIIVSEKLHEENKLSMYIYMFNSSVYDQHSKSALQLFNIIASFFFLSCFAKVKRFQTLKKKIKI